MIVITGAAGFIGSCLAGKLNQEGFYDLVLVDDFSDEKKNKNLYEKRYSKKIHRNDLFQWLRENHHLVQYIFHLGARTDTAEFNIKLLNRLNLEYSKQVWQICVEYGLPLVYASSAATYGRGEKGFMDDHTLPFELHPLNPYGCSKNDFDKWALSQRKKPYFWAGLKFFNVFGPNEYHKGRMASVVFHAYNQVKKAGKLNLFKSHHPNYDDGKQLRDFIYVKDVLEVCYFFMHHRKYSGIYNVGTGKAGTFLDLGKAVFRALNIPVNIEFIDTPVDIRDKYQYFTEAKMEKLNSIGYENEAYTFENAISEYVREYLEKRCYY